MTSLEYYLNEVVHVLLLCAGILLDFQSNCTFMFNIPHNIFICHTTTNSALWVLVYEPVIQYGDFFKGLGNWVLKTICSSGTTGLIYTCYAVKVNYHVLGK